MQLVQAVPHLSGLVLQTHFEDGIQLVSFFFFSPSSLRLYIHLVL